MKTNCYCIPVDNTIQYMCSSTAHCCPQSPNNQYEWIFSMPNQSNALYALTKYLIN